jgi:hypothetical protein
MMLKLRAILRMCAVVALMSVAGCGDNVTAPTVPVMEPQMITLTVGQESYTRIQERAPNTSLLSLSRILGILGGTLNVANHSVQVPFGAVLVPTLFTLTHANNGYVEVDASATLTDLLGRILDIGGLGFRKPVKMTLSYARATNVTDPRRLKIIRLNPNGQHEVMPSTVNTWNKTVSAPLDHFSRYALVSD